MTESPFPRESSICTIAQLEYFCAKCHGLPSIHGYVFKPFTPMESYVIASHENEEDNNCSFVFLVYPNVSLSCQLSSLRMRIQHVLRLRNVFNKEGADREQEFMIRKFTAMVRAGN
jgi:hypothetical protein